MADKTRLSLLPCLAREAINLFPLGTIQVSFRSSNIYLTDNIDSFSSILIISFLSHHRKKRTQLTGVLVNKIYARLFSLCSASIHASINHVRPFFHFRRETGNFLRQRKNREITIILFNFQQKALKVMKSLL